MAGQNDLSALLKSKVVKLQVRLDIAGSMKELKKQVTEITRRLSNKHVKLGVKLNYTVGDLNRQLKILSTTLENSKSFKPIKIKVDIDVAGSASVIKTRLKEISQTMSDFNSKYGKQLQEMQNKTKQIEAETQKGVTKVSSQAGVLNPNVIKNYKKALKEAESLMRSKLPSNEKSSAIFGAKEIKDAHGNLIGFNTTLERTNGIMEKWNYKYNGDKERFEVLDRTTVTAMEANFKKAQDVVRNLKTELDKTGAKSREFKQEYSKLLSMGKGDLTLDMAKDFERNIKYAKEENRVLRDQAKLIRDIKSAGRGIGGSKDLIGGVQGLLNKVRNNANGADGIKDLRIEWGKLNEKITEYKNKQKDSIAVDKQKAGLFRELNRLQHEYATGSGKITHDQINHTRNMLAQAKSTKDLIRVQKEMNTLSKAEDSIKRNSGLENSWKRLEATMKRAGEVAGLSSKTMKARIRDVQSQYGRSIPAMEEQIKRFEKIMTRAGNKRYFDNLDREIKSVINTVSKAKVLGFVDSNDSKGLRNYISQMESLNVATSKISDPNNKGIAKFTATLESTGKTAERVTYAIDTTTGAVKRLKTESTFNRNANLGVFEQLRIAMARVPVWMASMTVFYGSIRTIQSMSTEIMKVDKALTDLNRVADANTNIENVFKGAIEMGQQLGNNIHNIMETLNEFARTFGSFSDRQLLDITRTATLMSNVSELTTQESGLAIVTTMHAFNIAASESIRIVDALNEVDNKYAVSTKQLAEGLSKTASTSRTFGVTLEESLGHITAISSVTGESGKVIGNGLKTIYSRITTMDDASDILDSIGISIKTIGENGEEHVRPVNAILTDLAEKWWDLSDSQRQNIGVTMAGRYQLSRFLGMMNNWTIAEEATNTAINSKGSAMRENASYMESLEAKVNKLKNAYTQFSLAVGDALLKDSIQLVIDGLTGLAKVGTMVSENFGVLPAIFTAVGIALMKMGIMGKAGTSMMSGLMGSYNKAQGMTGKEAWGVQGLIDGFNKLRDSAKSTFTSVGSLSETARTGMVMYNQEVTRLWSKTGKAVSPLTKLNIISQVLSTTFMKLSTGIKMIGTAVVSTVRLVSSLAIQMAVFMAIGYAIEKLISWYQKKKQAEEEAIKVQNTMINSYRDNSDELDRLNTRYLELDAKFKNTSSAPQNKEENEQYQEYIEVQNELAQLLPTTATYVDELGNAHIKNSEAVKEAVDLAGKLSEAEGERELDEYNNLLDDNTEKLRKNIVQLNRRKIETNFLKSTDSKGQASALVAELTARQELQGTIQDTINLAQDQTKAFLASTGQVGVLTDSQTAMYENLAVAMKKPLSEIATNKDLKMKDKLEQYNEVVTQTIAKNEKMVEAFAKANKAMVKEIRNDDSLSKEQQKQAISDLNTTIESISKAFSGVKDADVLTKLLGKENLPKLLEMKQALLDGTGTKNEFVAQLEAIGVKAPIANQAIANMAKSYGNFDVVQEAVADGAEEVVLALESLETATLSAMDTASSFLGITDTNKEAMKSYFDVITRAKNVYGEVFKSSEEYGEAIQRISVAMGFEKEVIEKNFGTFETYSGMINKATDATDGWELATNATVAEQKLFNEVQQIAKARAMDLTEAFGVWLTVMKLGGGTLEEATLKIGEAGEEADKAGDKTKQGADKVKESTDLLNGTEINVNTDQTQQNMQNMTNETDTAWASIKTFEANANGLKIQPLANILDTSKVDAKMDSTTTKVQKVESAIKKVSDAMSLIDSSGLTTLQQPISTIGKTVNSLMGELTTLSNEIEKVASNGKNISSISGYINDVITSMGNASRAVTDFNTQVSNITSISVSVTSVIDSFQALKSGIDSVIETISSNINKLKSALDELGKKSKTVADAVKKSFDGMSSRVASKTGSMISMHSAQSSMLKIVRTSANEAKTAVNKLNDAIVNSMSKLNNYISKANEARQKGSNLPNVPTSNGLSSPYSRVQDFTNGARQTSLSESVTNYAISVGSFNALSGTSEGSAGSMGSSGRIRVSQPMFSSSATRRKSSETRRKSSDYNSSKSEIAELYKVSSYERAMIRLETTISKLEAQMKGMNQYSEKYRQSLAIINRDEQKRLNLMKKELSSLIKRQGVIERNLKQLPATTKQNAKQRETFNKLQQEYDENLKAIQSMSVEVESLAIEIKERITEIFTNMVEQITKSYDRIIDDIGNKINNIDFKLNVAEITDEDNLALQGQLLSEKIILLQKQQTEQAKKLIELERLKQEAVNRYGSLSDTAQDLKKQIIDATETYQDTVLSILNSQRAIKNLRGSFADDAIDNIKSYYKKMKDIETKAIENSLDSFKKAHEEKMKMYDDEIKKIKNIYDERIKAIDKEKEEEDYEETVTQMTADKNAILDKIALLSRNDDPASKKKLEEMQKELKDKQKELDDYLLDRKREKLKEELEAQRDKQIEEIESEKETQEKIYDNEVKSLEDRKEAINDYYDAILEDEKRWSALRNEIVKGNFQALEGELSTLQTSIDGKNSDMFENMINSFNQYLATVRAGMAELGLATSGTGSGNSYEESIKPPQGNGNNSNKSRGKLSTGIFTEKASAQKVANQMKADYQALGAELKKESNGWRVVGEFSDIARATKVLEDMKKKKKIPFGYISQFNTGGYTGDWNGGGRLALLDQKELVLNKEDTSNILNVVKLVREIAGITPKLAQNNIKSLEGKTKGEGSIIYDNRIEMNIDNFSGTKQDSDNALKLIRKGMKKRGG